MSRTPKLLTRTNSYIGAVSPWVFVLMLAACGGDLTTPGEQVASVSVSPASITLMPGEPVLLSALAKDSQGKVAFPKTYSWTSSNTSVATVEPSATDSVVLAAVGEGSATITVTTEGQSGAAAVTVTVGEFFAFTSVVMGWDYSCGIAASGAAYCWGGNSLGQLGNETIQDTSGTPVRVSGDLTFASLSGGAGHMCGITTSGAAYCWGFNEDGQLGNGTMSNSGTPVPVSGGLTFGSMIAGSRHTCGVTTAGAAYCWGQGEVGQLGNGTTSSSPTPVAVSDDLTFASMHAGSDERHTCGVTTTGAAYCWGWNFEGQLGDGTTTTSTTPVAVSGGLTFASVSGGEVHTCGLTTSGAAYCWGENDSGQLGDGTTTTSSTPVAVSGDLTFASVTAGSFHTCGITASGATYCWGSNDDGQLGNGTRTFFDANPTPVAVSGRLTFASVSGSLWHTCGVTTIGVAYCWGWNQVGMLGNGKGSFTSWETMPVRVLGQP